jgi:hypothetical protein
MIGPVIDKYIE